MKKTLRKTLSWFLSLSLVCSLTVPALASDALGEDLTAQDTLLHEETQLSTNVFWSTAFSDLRTENLITYTPNREVTPIVTHGGVLTDRSTVSNTAKALESQGYRVVAGINGDFYNTGTGLPIGITVSKGRLLSSDSGYHAVGFRADGTAIMGKPQLKISADLGYSLLDEFGTPTQVVRTVAGVNKARVSTGGIFLYTYDFNAKHTTGTTDPGVDVLCTIEEGDIAIGSSAQLRVEQVLEATAPTPIGPDQVVLSANLKSDVFYVDALRRILPGSTLTISVTAADEGWNDVEYAVGALYSLVENGAVAPGLKNDVNPRTAVGMKADGTLLFYTIDGRKPGHSIGASMTQVAQRLIELGCVTAICLDGGGSTTLSVTTPDKVEASTINRPSGGSERAVTNQIFLVASNEPSGHLDHFYVQPEYTQVLAGSKVSIAASAVDTAFIPMDRSFDLYASDGELVDNVLTTPRRDATVTVTASGGGREGSADIRVIASPDQVAIRNNGSIITTLSAAPGTVTQLTASAAWQHLPLHADAEAFDWAFTGDCGTVDATGKFTATAPGTGTLTVSAGGKSASVEVTVSSLSLKTVEDFEQGGGTFTNGSGSGMTLSVTRAGNQVCFGREALQMGYELSDFNDYTAEWYFTEPLTVAAPYTSLNLWVYGDGSGNTLELFGSNGSADNVPLLTVLLDFTGWKQVTLTDWTSGHALQGLRVRAPRNILSDDGFTILWDTPTTAMTGTLGLDQIVASFNGTVDTQVPSVTVKTAENGVLTVAVQDAVDGTLPKSAVSVALDGQPLSFDYSKSGLVTASYPVDGLAHRITVTAADASGNLGRASWDAAPGEEWVPRFTDTADYWGATYVDFLYTSGITTGYDDGTFRPNQNITRAQFSVMLYRYLKLDESRYADVVLPFADLDAIPDYALPAIRALYTEGVINGSTGSDGRLYFNPYQNLTRAQAATMIGRTQPKGYATVELSFTDAGQIPAYATFYIQTMAAQGIINGYSDGSFKPNNNITRGQMAKILYNLM